MPDNISPHVTYREATRSVTAIRKGIDNTPPLEVLARMRDVARECFEPARAHFGIAIPVSSFYRSPKLNKAIGGAAKSQHMTGEAMDLDCDGSAITNQQLFDFFRNRGNFDQLIWEYPDPQGNPSWLHVSWSATGNRGNILMAKKVNGRTVYRPFAP